MPACPGLDAPGALVAGSRLRGRGTRSSPAAARQGSQAPRRTCPRHCRTTSSGSSPARGKAGRQARRTATPRRSRCCPLSRSRRNSCPSPVVGPVAEDVDAVTAEPRAAREARPIHRGRRLGRRRRRNGRRQATPTRRPDRGASRRPDRRRRPGSCRADPPMRATLSAAAKATAPRRARLRRIAPGCGTPRCADAPRSGAPRSGGPPRWWSDVQPEGERGLGRRVRRAGARRRAGGWPCRWRGTRWRARPRRGCRRRR